MNENDSSVSVNLEKAIFEHISLAMDLFNLCEGYICAWQLEIILCWAILEVVFSNASPGRSKPNFQAEMGTVVLCMHFTSDVWKNWKAQITTELPILLES